MKRKVLIGLLVLLIVAQFFQPSHNNGTAEAATDITHAVQVPDSVMSLLKTSCYDCHSNHTDYPWYSKITPVNWWLEHHVNEGKRELNFSAFTNYTFKRKNKKLEQTADLVKKHEMPLDSYLWIHMDAKLNEAQIKLITDWTQSARQQVMQDSLQKSSYK
jgi:hypothetical protein